MKLRTVLAVLFVLVLVPSARAEEPEREAFGHNFFLTAFGGPASVDVDVFLNGEYAVTLGDDEELFREIADLVHPGANDLRIVTKKPETPREGGELTIEIRAVERSGRKRTTVGNPFASLTIPETFDPETACEETIPFELKPDAPPNKDLKNQWFLFVWGPPSATRVSVRINGSLAWSGTDGGRWIDVSSMLVKGKNTVVFEGSPTCFAGPDAGKERLTLEIAPARMEGHRIEQTEHALAGYDVASDRKGQTFSVKRTFRAW